MREIDLQKKKILFGGQSFSIAYPLQAVEVIDFLFLDFSSSLSSDAVETDSVIEVLYDQDNRFYSVVIDGNKTGAELDQGGLAHHLLAWVAHTFAHTVRNGIVIRGGAVRHNGKGVLLPGSKKSDLVVWLLAEGYAYLTDRTVRFENDSSSFSALPCPLTINRSKLSAATASLVEEFISSVGDRAFTLRNRPSVLVPHSIFTDDPIPKTQQLDLLLFTERQENFPFALSLISPGQAAQRLMGCLENHQVLGLQGFRQVADLTRQVPALLLQYADCEQLDDLLLPMLDAILDNECPPQALEKMINAFSALLERQRVLCIEQTTTTVYPVQQATPPGKKKKITIGMATYDDYDGVYFSVQALRMYHPEVIDQCEILVIDNHPDGPCSESLKKLDASIPDYRYVPLADVQGTAAARDALFQHAVGDFVLCMDCHVFLVPDALKKLVDYFTEYPDTCDLLQGPMIHDDLKNISTHFQPIWQGGMYGTWGYDTRGADPEGEPFDIPMQGVGLFACRRDAWPGFNPRFYGFGADEGYIHEKFRQAGGRTLCLPFLRWLHRFARPMGVPYPVVWKDRIYNYLLGFSELGLDIVPIREHFTELLGKEEAERIFKEVEKEISVYIRATAAISSSKTAGNKKT